MSTIKPDYRSVQQLLQRQSFSIDEYQREYKWEKANIDELLNDLRERNSRAATTPAMGRKGQRLRGLS